MRRSSQTSYALIGLVVVVGIVIYGLWTLLSAGQPAAGPAPIAPAASVTSTTRPTATVAPTLAPTEAPTRAAATPTATRAAPSTPRGATSTPRAAATPTTDSSLIMRNVKIYALDGRLAYQGDVDLRPVLDRIAAGIRDSHSNDGTVFGNFERRLPVQRDREYYREYVIRTPNLREVGPQRLIMGKAGEVYYTPDHYDTFVRVR